MSNRNIFDPKAKEDAEIYVQLADGADHPFTGKKLCVSEQQELVVRSYLDDGMTPNQICDEHALDPATVNTIIRQARLRKKADSIKKDIEKRIFEDKLPILEAIGDAGMVCLLEWMQELHDSGRHLTMAPDNAAKLMGIIKDLHGMFRLEMGKSTQNVDVLIEKNERTVSVILHELQKPSEEGGDPFVVYPEAAAGGSK